MRDSYTRIRARELRSRLTDSERHLWQCVRKQQLGCRFRRQFPIGPYIADFVCLDPLIVLEIDGGQHASQSAYDESRERFIRGKGFTILRFWSNEVLMQTEAVLQVIWRDVEEKKLPPSCPSPASAGEGT